MEKKREYKNKREIENEDDKEYSIFSITYSSESSIFHRLFFSFSFFFYLLRSHFVDIFSRYDITKKKN